MSARFGQHSDGRDLSLLRIESGGLTRCSIDGKAFTAKLIRKKGLLFLAVLGKACRELPLAWTLLEPET